jgi:hypothetical protein
LRSKHFTGSIVTLERKHLICNSTHFAMGWRQYMYIF